jgi:hypothetical protein
MPRILAILSVLIVAATSVAWAAYKALYSLTLSEELLHVSWALSAYLYLINLTQQVLKEATELLGHPSLSPVMVMKVSRRIEAIRSACYALHSYFALSAIIGLGATLSAVSMGVPVAVMLGVLIGTSIVSLLAMLWLFARQQEIYRFRVRLEKLKRDDDRRDRQIKDFGTDDAPDNGQDPPTMMRVLAPG